MSVQRVELGIDEGTGLLEMPDGILTIALAVLQHRKHGVAGRIRRTQSQQAVQERHGTATAGLVVQLSGPLERWDVVGRAFQRLLEGGQRRLGLAFVRQRNAVQRPQLRIVGVILQRRPAELNGPVELLRAQGRTDGFDLVLLVVGGTQTRQSVECSQDFTRGCKARQHGNYDSCVSHQRDFRTHQHKICRQVFEALQSTRRTHHAPVRRPTYYKLRVLRRGLEPRDDPSRCA